MPDPITAAIRYALTRRITLLITIGATVFTVALAPGSFMGDLSVVTRLLINSVNAAVFWGCTYWLLGRWVRLGLRHRMSWAISQTLFYTPFAAANTIGYSVFLTDSATVATTMAGFGAVMAMVVVTVLFTMAVFQNYLTAAMAQAGYPPHLFRWQRKNAARPEGERPTPIKLVAANQYVEHVTPEGTDLVRTTLKQAIDAQARDDGFQINRSTWVRWSAVADVVREKDRLCLHLSDGSTAYVSRAKVAAFEQDFVRYRHRALADQLISSTGQ